MKWLGERPRSLVEAWNILCEAVNERMEFYGIEKINRQFFPLPQLPCTRSGREIRNMLAFMREVICELVKYSWDWRQSGLWSENPAGFGRPSAPDHPLFEACKADGFAFFRTPEKVPSYRHSSSDFIRAAAGVLDFAVRYPAPKIGDTAPAFGFGFSARLEAESFIDGKHYSGYSQENGALQLPSNMSSLGVVSLSTICRWIKGVGRARAYNYRCVYCGAGTMGRDYRMPLLFGSGQMRTKMFVQYRSGLAGESEKRIELDPQEFTLRFDTGESEKTLDLSRIAPEISSIWNRDDSVPATSGSAVLNFDSPAVKITAENFERLTYKYME